MPERYQVNDTSSHKLNELKNLDDYYLLLNLLKSSISALSVILIYSKPKYWHLINDF